MLKFIIVSLVLVVAVSASSDEPEPIVRSVKYTAKPPLPDDEQIGQDIDNRAHQAFDA